MALHPLHKKIRPDRWCVTFKDLTDFEHGARRLWEKGDIPASSKYPNPNHDVPSIGPNIYQLNEHYIKPTTLAAGGMSWALMLNPRGIRCQVFVSHAWAEGIFEFCRKVRQTWPFMARNLYCCFLSNPQNCNIRELLGSDPIDSPFAQAMKTSRYVLVVPNSQVSIYTRLWCVFEAFLAFEQDRIIRLPMRPQPKVVLKLLAPGFVFFVAAFISVAYAISTHVAMTLSTDFGQILRVIIPIYGIFASMFLASDLVYCRCVSPKVVLLSMAVWSGWVLAFVCHIFDEIPTLGLVRCRKLAYFALPTLALPLAACQSAAATLFAETVREESKQLAFDSVSAAECSCEEDRLAIQMSIRGKEDEMDAAINVLRATGRYDVSVKANLRKGLSQERIREGLNFFKAAACTCCWIVQFRGTVLEIDLVRRKPECLFKAHHTAECLEFVFDTKLPRLCLYLLVLGSLLVVIVCKGFDGHAIYASNVMLRAALVTQIVNALFFCPPLDECTLAILLITRFVVGTCALLIGVGLCYRFYFVSSEREGDGAQRRDTGAYRSLQTGLSAVSFETEESYSSSEDEGTCCIDEQLVTPSMRSYISIVRE